MGWTEAMNRLLAPLENKNAYVTSPYGAYRSVGTNPHIGIDINYNVPGQKGINLTHPKIGSPVSGVVTAIGGKYGIIRIKDSDGLFHDVLHTEEQYVKVGDRVIENQTIGTMGDTGVKPTSGTNYHVHYHVIRKGKYIDPRDFWNEKDKNPSTPTMELRLNEYDAPDWVLRGTLPDCFVAGTEISMADGSRKPIEKIKIGDRVRAYEISEFGISEQFTVKEVSRLFNNVSHQIINLRGLYCTAGHVFCCFDPSSNSFSFQTIGSILKEDKAVVDNQMLNIRARTGSVIGSKDDLPVRVLLNDDECISTRIAVVRAGMPLKLLDQTRNKLVGIKLIDLIEHAGAKILPDSSVLTAEGEVLNAVELPTCINVLKEPSYHNWIVEVDGDFYTPDWLASLDVTEDIPKISRIN